MAGLCRRLHERGGNPHEFGGDVLRALALASSGHGRLPRLVELSRRLLDFPSDGVGDSSLAEGQRVAGAGFEESLARGRRGGVLLRGEFKLHAGGQQAGPARMLLREPLDLVEGRRRLVTLDEPV